MRTPISSGSWLVPACMKRSLSFVRITPLTTRIEEITPPDAYVRTLVHEYGGGAWWVHDGIAYEAKCFGEVCGTKDMRIGVDNFITNGPRSKADFVHE